MRREGDSMVSRTHGALFIADNHQFGYRQFGYRQFGYE